MSMLQAVSAVISKVRALFLPAELTVWVHHHDAEGAPKTNHITVKGKTAKSSGRPFWKGGKSGNVLRDAKGRYGDTEATFADLEGVTLTIWDNQPPVTLTAGKVHPSLPRTYPKGHAKAGQVQPGTGGNTTITYSGVVSIVERDASGDDKDEQGNPNPSHSYTVWATLTRVFQLVENEKGESSRQDAGYRVSLTVIPHAAGNASADGDFESFSDLAA